MRVALINPPRVQGYPVVREERYEHKDLGALYPPLGLLTLSPLLETRGHEVYFFDANGLNADLSAVEVFLRSCAPEVVFLRFGFDTQEQDLRVCDLAKSMGAQVVVRNKIIGDLPAMRDEILARDSVDVFLSGEPERLLPETVAFLAQGGEKPNGTLMKEDLGSEASCWVWEDLDSLPQPDYGILPQPWPYHTGVLQAPMATLWTSCGCPYRCTFCAYGRQKQRKKSPGRVLEEMEQLTQDWGVRRFLIFDDLLDVASERMETLCQGMLDRLPSLEWVACARADGVDRKGLALMKRAGCVEVAIGIESGAPSVLERTGKGVTLDQIERAAAWCHEVDMLFYGMVVLGLPGETRGTIGQTVSFLQRIDPFYVQFCFATPFPNTEMYSYYEREGLLLTRDWSRYFPLAERPVVRTHDLTDMDLCDLRRWVYSRMLLRPRNLLRHARRGGWSWRLRAGWNLAGRLARLAMRMPVR